MRRNNLSKIFYFNERQWDSSEQDPCTEFLQEPDVRCTVKRLSSGTLQLPRLSCRPFTHDGSQSGPSPRRIKPSRSLGTLTSCISRDL
ncbi:hypothetical protein PBY51_021304 [Eleginops maclovinus]|uniref:Uncharacterized protein n=1 Tax=Eleginops maclovinus TaxID=56733 RepID=A0AAN7XFL0_ELEMC|nr:hypothetical protein PBY51_021304 [Eleginops maclovinus]